MTRATRWTDEKIKSLKLPTGSSEKRFLVDSGLYLRLRHRNEGLAKHWQYRVQVDGARHWLTMGTYPALSLAHARSQLLQHDVEHQAAKKGEADHPAIAAREARKAAKALPTVTEVFDEWLADKRLGSSRKGGAPVRERTITVLKDNFDLDIRARIGDVKISRLTRMALQDCIDGPRKRNAPGSAAQVYRTLRGLVSFAIKRDYIAGLDPMRGIDNPRPYRPGPVNAASDAELVALFTTLESSAMWPATKLAIELMLLTGVRPRGGQTRILGRDRPGEGDVDHPCRTGQVGADVHGPFVAGCPRLVRSSTRAARTERDQRSSTERFRISRRHWRPSREDGGCPRPRADRRAPRRQRRQEASAP